MTPVDQRVPVTVTLRPILTSPHLPPRYVVLLSVVTVSAPTVNVSPGHFPASESTMPLTVTWAGGVGEGDGVGPGDGAAACETV